MRLQQRLPELRPAQGRHALRQGVEQGVVRWWQPFHIEHGVDPPDPWVLLAGLEPGESRKLVAHHPPLFGRAVEGDREEARIADGPTLENEGSGRGRHQSLLDRRRSLAGAERDRDVDLTVGQELPLGGFAFGKDLAGSPEIWVQGVEIGP